jgi:hypothetical protein
MRNKLVPSEKYLADAAAFIGDDEESPKFEAHRRVLLDLIQRAPRPPPSGGNPSYRRVVTEPIDDLRELILSVWIHPMRGGDCAIELRGLKVKARGVWIL